MADGTSFKDKQYAFAAHIRDPDNVAAPGNIEGRRMAIYRKLFFNNLYSLLGTFFPVLRKIHTDEQWRRFIRGIMRHHQAQTPYFLQLPEEFLAYLQNDPAHDDISQCRTDHLAFPQLRPELLAGRFRHGSVV